MSLFPQLQDIIASTLDIPQQRINEQSTMNDIEEWDSLGHVHIMVALEQAFDLFMDAEDLAELDNVTAILAYLERESAG